MTKTGDLRQDSARRTACRSAQHGGEFLRGLAQGLNPERDGVDNAMHQGAASPIQSDRRDNS